MNILKKVLIVGGCSAALVLGGGKLHAQGRGNFDPAEMRQRMMDRLRDQMSITDDTEWQAIEPKVGKVFDARRDLMGIEMAGFRGGRPRGGGGGGGGNGGDNNGDGQGQRRQRGGFFGEPDPTVDALQKAVDDKAPKDELKAKIAAFRADYKAKRATLEAAQDDLRGVLTTRQEAVATVNGLLQ